MTYRGAASSYTARRFATAYAMNVPATPRLAVVLPAYNEAGNLAEVLQRLSGSPAREIVVVDDCSTDATVEVARAAGVTVLSMPFRFGAWTATQAGLRYAFKHGFDCAVTMDADGQHDPRGIPDLVEPVASGEADVVIGACVSRASRQRRLVWRYLRWLTNLDIADLTSGYRAYSRRAIAVAASWPATSFDYQDVGLLLLLRRRGMRIVEREVSMSPRRDGKSRIFSSWLQVARYVAFSSMHGWSKRADARAPARLPGSSRA